MQNALLTGATRLRAIVAAETDRSAADSTPFVADGRTFDVTRKLARNFDSFTWLPDSSGLLLVGEGRNAIGDVGAGPQRRQQPHRPRHRGDGRKAECVLDSNVPLVNSYEWYHALRDNAVPVRFYAYPANTHFPGGIVHTTDIFRRWVGWMTAHLH